MPEPAVVEHDPWNDLQPLLDQELSQLPENYRAVVILCDLEGKSRREAARQLDLPEGTVASRLARARTTLAKRLARHGPAVSGSVLATVLSRNAASGCVPTSVMSSTIEAMTLVAAGQSAASGVISAQVAALLQGVLTTMLFTKLKSAIAVLLVLGAATLTVGAMISRSRATEPAEASAESQKQERTNREDLHNRVVKLKRQLQQMQDQIARLEWETLPRHEERSPRDAFLADRFKYRVPFEIGFTQTKEGGRIEIREVWGTRPRIEVGGQYLVRGKYVLPPGERGKLYFYATAGGDWGAIGTTLDLQSTTVDKREGEFTLVHGMLGPGYFHLILTEREHYSRWFANVYFGTGDNVLRKTP
jgi:hypothetical protein